MARGKDATMIIFDIGKNVSLSEEKNQKSFFENAKHCISHILERKIMSRPDDLMGIILLGSKKTKNNLAEQLVGSFTNIEMLSELVQPTWQLLRDLPEQPTNKNGDWFEAMLVAADYFKNGLYGVKVSTKKIVLMTNFQTPACLGNNVHQVMKGFEEEGFEVTVIGQDIFSEDLQGEDIKFVRDFVQITNGDVATFDDAMRYLLFHRKKATRAIPWNVDLSIGSNIKIPVSVYGRIREDNVIKSWQKAVRNVVTNKSSVEEAVTKKKEFINNDNQAVESEETIQGYMYGGKATPISDNDKSMFYKSGEKCLSVYGFTKADNIKWQNLSGNGVSYLFGRKGHKKSANTVQCLTECLLELNVVGIARRVYNNGNAPMMHVIFPIIDTNDFMCLSVVGINYKEDIKNMAFPPTELPKYDCTNEQIDAFVKLIKSMDLTCAYDESYDDREAYPIGETVNPSIQHVLDCIAFRAMNPGKPLPPPREEIMMLFKVPAPIEKRSRDQIEKVKKLFDLKKVEPKPVNSRKKTNLPNYNMDIDVRNQNQANHDMPKVQLPNFSDEVFYIGTLNPIEDFKILQKNDKSLKELSMEMIDVLETLVYVNTSDDYTRTIEVMKFFREECVKNDPSHYNNWLLQFKKDLYERKREDFLQLMSENNLNLITKDENNSSTLTDQETDDSQVYENNTIPESTELSIQTEANDFFDEM